MSTFTMVPDHVEIQLYSGDDFRARVDMRTSAGNSLDVTGVFLAQIRPAGWVDIITTFGVDDVSAATGTLFLTLTAVQTQMLADFEFAPYFSYDLQWTSPDGIVTTIIAGTITIIQDVSRSV